MKSEDSERIARLCPHLRKIVDVELSRGNAVSESWDNWGFVVLLSLPFRETHDLDSGKLSYREVNDPHYWKSEYTCEEHQQSVACGFK